MKKPTLSVSFHFCLFIVNGDHFTVGVFHDLNGKQEPPLNLNSEQITCVICYFSLCGSKCDAAGNELKMTGGQVLMIREVFFLLFKLTLLTSRTYRGSLVLRLWRSEYGKSRHVIASCLLWLCDIVYRTSSLHSPCAAMMSAFVFSYSATFLTTGVIFPKLATS